MWLIHLVAEFALTASAASGIQRMIHDVARVPADFTDETRNVATTRGKCVNREDDMTMRWYTATCRAIP